MPCTSSTTSNAEIARNPHALLGFRRRGGICFVGARITSYNVCYTKLLRARCDVRHLVRHLVRNLVRLWFYGPAPL